MCGDDCKCDLLYILDIILLRVEWVLLPIMVNILTVLYECSGISLFAMLYRD